MFTKGIVLSETEYGTLWNDFEELLRDDLEELGENELQRLLSDKERLKRWVKDRVVEMFDLVLEENNVECAVVFLEDKGHYVPDGEEFYYLSYREGTVEVVVDNLKEELETKIRRR
jgi:hypothetical protein